MARGLLAGRGGGGGVSVPIAVAVRVPGQRIQGVVLVRVPVAVVVGAIADLQASRVGCGCCVVAIIPVPGVPGRRCTGVGGGGGISVAIAVRIGVPGGLDPFVDIPIAVVVALITGLGSAGVAVGIQVVTVIVCGDKPGRCRTGGLDELLPAVPVAVRIPVPGRSIHHIGIIAVGKPITVIVDPVAGLGSIVVHGSICIVAVDAGGKAIPVRISESHRAVAVVVGSVGAVGFGCSRVVHRVRIVTVPAKGGVSSGQCAGVHGGCIVPVSVAIGVREEDRRI